MGATGRARYWVAELLKAHVRRLAHRRQLEVVRLRSGLRRSAHVVVLVVHDEADRLVHLLGYYRDLGFDHFIVIDNESDDDLADLLADAQDVSVVAAHGSYRAARFGNDWVNEVLSRYCRGKWVLYVDADEYLVWAEIANGVAPLTAELERRGERSLRTLMLDMYSERPVAENACDRGQDPLTVCDLYDASGYQTHLDEVSRASWIKGGVRGRVYFDDIALGPALNKTPLVRWRAHYAFLKSAHQLFPPSLNGPGAIEPLPRAAVLLHFKFLASFTEKLVLEERRRQHTEEYAAYANVGGQVFVGGPTRRYEGPESLLRDHILRIL